MPNSPKKIKRPWAPDRKPFQRGITNYKFYNSARWRKISRLFKEANPLCVKCMEEGRTVPSEFTDHVVRIQDGGDKFAYSNLQALCAFHHNQKSGKEGHGFKQK